MYRSRPNAPFKAPRLVRKVEDNEKVNNENKNIVSGGQAESKRRNEDIQATPKVVPVKRVKLHSRAQFDSPLQPLARDVPEVINSSTSGPSQKERYAVQWRKRTNKKNKTWDGDGYIIVQRDVVIDTNVSIMFKQLDGKQSGKKSFTNTNVEQLLGNLICIGQNEIEVDYKINTNEEFRRLTGMEMEDEVEGASQPTVQPVSLAHPSQALKPVSINSSFKKVLPASYEPLAPKKHSRVPLYDDSRAIVLPRPDGNEAEIVDVLIDPLLAVKLRPHQVDGVIFLYECLMGFRDYDGKGCLLADEMGLGKTLMTITLIWTLYKQNPFLSQHKPILHKVLICCPVSLIDNWKREFKKWIGQNRISILTLSGNSSTSSDKQNLASFGNLNVYQILIINYEKVSAYHKELANIKFDLLVCDEGHRLKSSTNKVMNHLASFDIPRKILLTGTPIQNDLVEYYTIINFINPGILGDYKTFQKSYINPILKSRDVKCFDPAVKKLGAEMSNKLIEITQKFTLRRTQSILLNYLTQKTDIILFVPPTSLQKRLFHYILNLRSFNELLNDASSSTNQAFTLINLFKKLCNSPSLLMDDGFFSNLVKDEKDGAELCNKTTLTTSSGKINILIPLLLEITSLKEKTVLISNYTKTLDLLEIILKKLDMSFLRLDGSTPKNVRDKLVNQFNKTGIQVFLLSSKSGGMGLNLVGASRLILFDNDWNPSIDLQSMSRIHRDGQHKPCFIYRILTTGTIDEKIFQRQLMKTKLSSKFLDNTSHSASDVFDYNDLKNLFKIEEETASNTHDLLECSCASDGENLFVDTDTDAEEEVDLDSLKQNSWMSASDLREKIDKEGDKRSSIKHALNDYRHFDPLRSNRSKVSESMNDTVLVNILNNKGYDSKSFPISYIMTRMSEKSVPSEEEEEEMVE
ncbi:helicase [Scheffersomyces xylosifermentans]|uniref:helicase n=1 Tax=Scheffersomyces xylosifermentans TaxID=1304137 RepID=UPI00315D4697